MMYPMRRFESLPTNDQIRTEPTRSAVNLRGDRIAMPTEINHQIINVDPMAFVQVRCKAWDKR